MTYIDQKHGRERVTSAVATAVIVGGIGYALVTGLAMRVVKLPEVLMPTRDWTAPAPPPPVERPAEQVAPRAGPVTPLPPVPTTIVPMPPVAPTIELPPLPLSPIVVATGGGLAIDPPAAPRQPPTAIGDRTGWVSADDYPSAALRAGAEGRTGVSLAIGANGRVTACTVTGTSGSSDLDRAACQSLQRRARFRPARDPAGNAVPATVPDAVVWRLPRD